MQSLHSPKDGTQKTNLSLLRELHWDNCKLSTANMHTFTIAANEFFTLDVNRGTIPRVRENNKIRRTRTLADMSLKSQSGSLLMRMQANRQETRELSRLSVPDGHCIHFGDTTCEAEQ